MEIHFTLNGVPVSATIEDNLTLLELLRDQFALKGTKEGCGYGECGTCTVIVNNKAINSCLMLAAFVNDKIVKTIESLQCNEGPVDSLVQSFIDHGAIQCGFCTPGMIMNAKALLDENPNISENGIKEGMAGNLCRCTGYVKINSAIKGHAEKISANNQ